MPALAWEGDQGAEAALEEPLPHTHQLKVIFLNGLGQALQTVY